MILSKAIEDGYRYIYIIMISTKEYSLPALKVWPPGDFPEAGNSDWLEGRLAKACGEPDRASSLGSAPPHPAFTRVLGSFLRGKLPGEDWDNNVY